jgi:hypothetical protein
MNNKKSDEIIGGHQHKSLESVQMMQTADGKKNVCYELFVFRSILEKLMPVNLEDYTWTWDHETDTFLIQARNNIIQQYIVILTRELGEALCLHLDRISIIVDLRPWKTDADKTSLRIGIEGKQIPRELQGHTGLEDLIKLHFISRPDDSPVIQKSLDNFKRMCYRVDSILDRKFEWMWEKHWRKDGLAFAVVRTYAWLNKYVLVEKEVELFNNAPANRQAGVKVELSTYNRGTLFNIRIAADGLTNTLRKNAHILDVFDTHFAGSIK